MRDVNLKARVAVKHILGNFWNECCNIYKKGIFSMFKITLGRIDKLMISVSLYNILFSNHYIKWYAHYL